MVIRKLLGLFFFGFFFVTGAIAQQATITGTVTSQDGEVIPAVNVVIQELQKGTATNANGVYTIKNVPLGTYTLKVTFLGFNESTKTIELSSSGNYTKDFVLEESVLGMDEVVVTGVATGTQKEKLGFTVEDVGEEQLEKVTAINPAEALQGKVAGIKVSSTSGAPGAGSDIQLRGAKAIFGSSNPLIIVDGVITEGSLSDINSQDIKSIEVVKGAAASSLYGSRAANGVINIITKRGSGLKGGQTEIEYRSEVGRSFMGYIPEKSSSTNYVVSNGEVQYDQTAPDGIYDNPYPSTTDPVDQFFDPGAYFSNYLSFQANSEEAATSIFSSIQHTKEAGVVKLTDGQSRLNLRVNMDHYFNDDFKFSASNLYSQSEIDHRADGVWDMFYYADPNADLLAKNEEDGSPYNVDPNRLGKSQNPLYLINNTVNNENRNRFLGHYELNYDPFDYLNFSAAYGVDRMSSSTNGLTPKGKLNVDQPPSQGSIYKAESSTFAQTLQADAMFQREFGDLNTRFSLQYLHESNEYKYQSSSGSQLAVEGLDVSSLELASENIDIHSSNSTVVANNFSGVLFLDYKDKYIIDGLIRRDGVSLFGQEERWQTFYRISGAWRVTEDFNIPGVQELKLRTSYGIAGLRPPFEAQYEVIGLSNGNITSPVTLGNEDLKPSFSKELEMGIDATFLDRFNFSASYSRALNTDQILNVPVSASTGFASQWQNAGTLKSTALEVSLGGNLIQKNDWNWNVNILWDRTRQKVVELNREGYAIVSGGIFQISEGTTFGTLYGHKWATSLNEVQNQVPDGESVSDYFAINNEGYIVRRSDIGTVNEVPIKIRDDQGNPINTEIGDVNPDFNVNFTSSLDYKNLNLYMLWSWQQGGDVYNHMRRYMMVNNVGKELDQSGKPEAQKKSAQYYNELTSWNNSHFVEDATYLKLRELSVSYNLRSEKLTDIGIQNIRLGVVGRNLLTFTGYTGFDPETGSSESGLDSNILKFDLSSYPVYRTLSASVGITF